MANHPAPFSTVDDGGGRTMTIFSRREFLQTTLASSVLAAVERGMAESSPARLTASDGKVKATGKTYSWEWRQADDQWRLLDGRGFEIAHGKIQPAVVVKFADGGRHCMPGRPQSPALHGNRLSIRYQGVNGSSESTL